MGQPPVDSVGSPVTLGGRYRLGECLGRGGMGEVRAGRDLRLERDVAVKLLRSEMASQPTVRQRFEVEARAAASLVHPHVVAVFDSGEESGVPFLVMERLDGRTLAEAIDDGPMEPGAVRQLGLQILSALGAAHAAGLIHRDIKPANVLAAGPGNWKVGDFGIAKSLEANDPALTSTGLIVGTPAYLAPERLAGGPATPSSDLYAVGVVLYEAAVGLRGRGSLSSLSAYGRPLPRLDQLRPDLPADLVAIVAKATASDPAARFGSAGEMAAWLRGQGVATSMAPTAATAAAAALAATAALASPAPTEMLAGALAGQLPGPILAPDAQLVSRRRALFAAVAAGVGLIIVALAISLGGRNTTSTATPTSSTTSTSTTAASPTTTTARVAPVATVVAHSSTATKSSGKGHGKHGKG